jgi:hypothetical protein
MPSRSACSCGDLADFAFRASLKAGTPGALHTQVADLLDRTINVE